MYGNVMASAETVFKGTVPKLLRVYKVFDTPSQCLVFTLDAV